MSISLSCVIEGCNRLPNAFSQMICVVMVLTPEPGAVVWGGGREGHLFMANLVRTFAHLKVLIKAIDFDI
jgi:hypothetical protein